MIDFGGFNNEAYIVFLKRNFRWWWS